MPSFVLLCIYTVNIATCLYAYGIGNYLALSLGLVILGLNWLLTISATEMFAVSSILSETIISLVDEIKKDEKENPESETDRRKSLQTVLDSTLRVYNEKRPRFFGRQRN